jgi:hypothetical protein|tara:strand:- start:103 stop:249 length:147 start_codon:yes stop_codon:yes gene_type:complete
MPLVAVDMKVVLVVLVDQALVEMDPHMGVTIQLEITAAPTLDPVAVVV